MTMSTLHNQHIIYLSSDSHVQLNCKVLPLLKENEKVAFDLHSRTLILTTGDLATRVARLSPIDAHLLLPLVYFYPHHVSDSTFAIGYTVDLFIYYRYLKGEMERRKPDGTYPIADGIDRLKKRVISLEEAAKLLSLSRTMVYELINREGLPVHRINSEVRISPSELQKWLDERKETV